MMPVSILIYTFTDTTQRKIPGPSVPLLLLRAPSGTTTDPQVAVRFAYQCRRMCLNDSALMCKLQTRPQPSHICRPLHTCCSAEAPGSTKPLPYRVGHGGSRHQTSFGCTQTEGGGGSIKRTSRLHMSCARNCLDRQCGSTSAARNLRRASPAPTFLRSIWIFQCSKFSSWQLHSV